MTIQQNKNNTTQNTPAAMGSVQDSVTGSLNNVVGAVRKGSTGLVNSLSNMSTGKKLLALAAVALGANMLKKRMRK